MTKYELKCVFENDIGMSHNDMVESENGDFYHCDEVDTKIKQLRDALIKYGSHFRGCPQFENIHYGCTCGFATVIKDGGM